MNALFVKLDLWLSRKLTKIIVDNVYLVNNILKIRLCITYSQSDFLCPEFKKIIAVLGKNIHIYTHVINRKWII